MDALHIDTLAQYPGAGAALTAPLLQKAFAGFAHKVIVLDDDPTGIQTVHGVPVYTEWNREALTQGFTEAGNMFFVLTNSRSFSLDKTRRVHCEIGRAVEDISRQTGVPYLLLSRGDSTLRGHYPAETEALRAGVKEAGGKDFDGEIICPFFMEGGRYTLGDIHYVQEGEWLIPAGQTEFAKDRSFGYRASSLVDWCLEKYGGALAKEQITTIPLALLQKANVEEIARRLMAAEHFGKVVVNAVCYSDIEVFCAALLHAIGQGKQFLFRTAAALPRVLGQIGSKPLLGREELVPGESKTGGIILAGSHVAKTTRQLQALEQCKYPVQFIQFDQHRVLEEGGLQKEMEQVTAQADSAIAAGQTVVVLTRRERVDVKNGDSDAQLRISTAISDALTGVIGSLSVRPRFIVAKGGITSSDVGTKALRVKRAEVAGQILPGVPVWKTGGESKFPRLPFIIFPGNVGSDDALRQVVELLMAPSQGIC